MRIVGILAASLIMTANPAAAEMVLLHAAGSLKAALTDVTNAHEKASGDKIEAKYGPSRTQLEELYRAPVETVTDAAGKTAFLPG